WQDTHINIVDTPGHADFGGEVERALSMVDGVLLLIDAQEGPMPQTRFVTKKALALGLKPIVVVNKVDKPGANCDKVINAAFDLFDKLGANDEQLDFPVVYASGINGWSSLTEGAAGEQWGPDMSALFDTVLKHVPAHRGDPNAPLQGKAASKATEVLPNPAKPPATAEPAAAKPENKPAVSADPLGELARAQAGGQAGTPAEPFIYFVQIGAFRTPEDAESQRAKLSLTGVEAKVLEREQSGRMVYRVRVGPFDKREDAEKVKARIEAAGHESALVRVQR
ncbi:MAG: hypothetical protein RL468_1401, partial [Pseudomonadota bacterium]